MVDARLQAIRDVSRREAALLASSRPGAAEGQMVPDKLEAISAAVGVFEAIGVAYALIGGVAVGIRSGVPRATLDVDFAITMATDRPALIAAFVTAGFTHVGSHAHSLNFRHPDGEPVQLAFDPEFDAMIVRAEPVEAGATPVRVVVTTDLIAMKRRAAGDPARRRSKALRDQADIALLEGDVGSTDEGW